jgi:hypothetical protein
MDDYSTSDALSFVHTISIAGVPPWGCPRTSVA